MTGRLAGVIAAVPTPVTEDLSPDVERFLVHARWALDNGCAALNVLGTTGEANSFSRSQREGLMSAAASRLDAARLMVGTGTPDLETTVALTKHAETCGFAAALVVPPYYYKGVSDDGLFAYFKTLVAATDGAPIPIYLYNFPQMTGLTFSPALAGRLAQSFPGRIIGMKDSSGKLDYAAEIARIEGFDVFPSSEASLVRADADGFAGCISATASITAPIVHRLWEARQDAARLAPVQKAREEISAQPLIPSIKYLVSRLHDDASFARLVPPLTDLSEAQKAALPTLDTLI